MRKEGGTIRVMLGTGDWGLGGTTDDGQQTTDDKRWQTANSKEQAAKGYGVSCEQRTKNREQTARSEGGEQAIAEQRTGRWADTSVRPYGTGEP